MLICFPRLDHCIFSKEEPETPEEYEDLEFVVRKLLEEYEKWDLKIDFKKNFLHGLWSRNQRKLEYQKGYIRGCEESI